MIARCYRIAGLVLSVALATGGAASAQELTTGTAIVTTPVAAYSFAVEIADEAHERARGLMFRESLPVGTGMIFVYDPPEPSAFWMKNTPVPLDILFADGEGRIIEIARHTTPYSLTPIPSRGDSALVLEIGAGRAAALGIERGDRLSLIE